MNDVQKQKKVRATDPVMILNVQSLLAGKFEKLAAPDEVASDWDRFYDSYSRIIRRFAASCGMQDCDIDECSQEVWVAVVNGLNRFEHDPARARFRSWLYRIVSNKAADLVRDRMKHAAISLSDSNKTFDLRDNAPPPTQDLDAAWRNELLREAMNELKQTAKPRDYSVFVDRTIRNNPAARVANEHNMSEGGVRVVDHRLRKQLQQILCSLTDGQIVAEFGY